MYESQLAQLTQQTFNMESAALATENLRNTMATVDAMKLANKELQKQYGRIDVDKIEVRVCRVRSFAVAHGTPDHAFRHGGPAGASKRDSGNARKILCCP